jgi:integral membrane protein
LKVAMNNLRWVGYTEGTSFLVLLGIAMPLKYWANYPLAVTVVGSLHGGLWILYLLAAARAAVAEKWGVGKMAAAVIASVLPFGPFVLDAWLRREIPGPDLERTDYAEEHQV